MVRCTALRTRPLRAYCTVTPFTLAVLAAGTDYVHVMVHVQAVLQLHISRVHTTQCTAVHVC